MTLNEYWKHVEPFVSTKKLSFDPYRVLLHISLHCRRESGVFSTYVKVGRLTEDLGWKDLSKVEKAIQKLVDLGLIERRDVPHNKCGSLPGFVLVIPTATSGASAVPATANPANEPYNEAADPWWNDLSPYGWTHAEIDLFKTAGAHLIPWQAIRKVKECPKQYWTAEDLANRLREYTQEDANEQLGDKTKGEVA